MITIDSNTDELVKILDDEILSHKKQNNPGNLIGGINNDPKLSEEDLLKYMSVGDMAMAAQSYLYHIAKINAEEITKAAQTLLPRKLQSISGSFYYPPKGFMGWHTNSNYEGWRVYVTWAEEDKKGFFRYYYNGNVHTAWENKGWNFRAFEISKKNLYWHCVYTDCNRYSFGFKFE